MDMSPETIKHLEFLQAIIARMNRNSFQLKTMCITLVFAVLALVVATKTANLIVVSFLPIVVFWLLDSYYLQQERIFRGIYNNVAGLADTLTVLPFAMPVNKFKGGQYSYINVVRSKTILLFYLPIIIFILAIVYFLYSKQLPSFVKYLFYLF